MKPAIRVENLSKQYQMGAHKAGGYTTLREALVGAVVKPCQRLWNRAKGAGCENEPDSSFWALKDVSFEVQPGEVVGIIGRNGAGKSTLLKILSRITEPTDGRVEVRGRMGSLLEVGTGFHPELTGRENIYMNGSILGMSRREIDRKFDEIVAFSEIEQFLDTPVKRYSSGMYVRLAFAVAAHLEPEILVVDEVLAVGDAQFQKKCLGKMQEVGHSGRTVLFVSHNMTAVKALCGRCIWLKGGQIGEDGEPALAIRRSLAEMTDTSSAHQNLRNHPRRDSASRPVMSEVRLTTLDGRETAAVSMGQGLSIHVTLDSPMPLRPVLGLVIKEQYGGPLFGLNNRIVPGFHFATPLRQGCISCHYDALPLMPGSYGIDLYLGNEYADIDVIRDAITFDVLAEDVFGSGKLPPAVAGPICVPARWTLCQTDDVLQSATFAGDA